MVASIEQTDSTVGPDARWLEQLHQQWVATLDALRDAILVVDGSGKILRINRSFAALVQRPIQLVVGQPVAHEAAWLTGDGGTIVDYPVTSPNGRTVYPRLCDTDPRLFGRVYVLDDVTAEAALAKAEARFEAGRAQSYADTIKTLSQALHLSDPYTSTHGKNVALIARRLSRMLGHSDLQAQGIFYGALIHDIGKLSVPNSILNRPGTLAQAEMNLIRMHPETGFSIVKDLEFPWPVHEIILQHHERLDGSGYPSGLTGREISEAALIVGVADVVEAMSAHRPYRPARGLDAAADELRDGRGTRYEPRVVDACLELIRDGLTLPQLGEPASLDDCGG